MVHKETWIPETGLHLYQNSMIQKGRESNRTAELERNVGPYPMWKHGQQPLNNSGMEKTELDLLPLYQDGYPTLNLS